MDMNIFQYAVSHVFSKMILAALICFVGISGLQRSWGFEGIDEDRQVFETVRSVHFPHGFKVLDSRGRLIKTVNHPANELVRCVVMGKSFAYGKEAYMSDWSFNRLLNGKQPNWVVANDDPVSIYSEEDMEVFDSEKGVKFPYGYKIYDHRGNIIKSDSSNTGLNVRGRKVIHTSSGKKIAYLTSWAYNQVVEGKPPTWAIGSNSVEYYPKSNEKIETHNLPSLRLIVDKSVNESDDDAAKKWKLLGFWRDDQKQSYHIKENGVICISSESSKEMTNTWDVKNGLFIWESKSHEILGPINDKLVFRPKDSPGPIFTLTRVEKAEENVVE